MTRLFDPRDPAFFDDRFRAYALLRDEAPIARLASTDEVAYVITRYADVSALLRDPNMLVNASPNTIPEHVGTGSASIFYRHTLPRLDAPDHTRVRRHTRAAFNSHTFRRMRGQVERVIIDNIRSLPESGVVDFVSGFAHAVPGEIACRLAHVQPSQSGPFLEKVSHLLAILNQGVVDNDVRERADRAGDFYFDYYNRLIDEMRGKLDADDVVGQLIDSERAEAEEGLSRNELLVAVLNLLLASYHTTAIAISNALAYLLDRPDQLSLLKEDPALAPTAWNELLRFDAPVHFVPRYAANDTEVLGTKVKAGQRLLLCLASANRDERRFPKAEEIDIARKDNPHLTFATGSHACLGAQLSRMEGEILLGHLFKYYPDMRLTGERLEKTRDVSFPHFVSLPIDLGNRFQIDSST